MSTFPGKTTTPNIGTAFPGTQSETSLLAATSNSDCSDSVTTPALSNRVLPDAAFNLKKRKQRSENFLDEELKVLALCINEYQHIIDAAHSPTITNAMKKAAWEEIAEKVSAVCGIKRDAEQLKSKRKTLKSITKGKIANIRRERGKTGGGPSEAVVLTTVEELMGQTISEIEISGLPGGIDIYTFQGTNVSSTQETVPEDFDFNEIPLKKPHMNLPTDVNDSPSDLVRTPSPRQNLASGSRKSTRRFRSSLPISSTEKLLQKQLEIITEHTTVFKDIRLLMEERNQIEKEKLEVMKENVELRRRELEITSANVFEKDENVLC